MRQIIDVIFQISIEKQDEGYASDAVTIIERQFIIVNNQYQESHVFANLYFTVDNVENNFASSMNEL